MNQKTLLLVVALVGFCSEHSWAAGKYGDLAKPLSARTNAEYFKKNDAKDFWALIPFYTGQKLGQQCSAATFTTVLNAARGSIQLGTDDKLLTMETFLEKYAEEKYAKLMSGPIKVSELFGGKLDRSLIGNKHLVEVLRGASEKLGISGKNTKVELIPIDLQDPKKIEAARAKFHQMLIENEKSENDFMILSAFVQGKVTGDPEGRAHVSPVAGYDQKNKLVLILDVDRDWYEPYWIPEDKLFEAMATKEADANQPGWIYYQVR